MRQATSTTRSNRWTGTPSPGLLCNPTSPRKRGEVRTTLPPHLSPRAGRGRIALAIRVRGRFLKRRRDCFKNPGHIAEDVVVPEPQNSIVVTDKPFVANHVTRIACALASIHLNNETTFTTDKIDRVRADRFLPNELVAIEPARAVSMPQSCLSVGGVTSQPPGAVGLDLVSFPHVETPPHPDCCAIRPLAARGERLASHAIA
jgi:hypothetical protein